jgi:hypothetical protein
MQNGWIKVFEDGEIIAGPDCEQQTSWSKTRLSELNRVDLFFHGTGATIEGDGEYAQSDDYIVLLSGEKQQKPERLFRRLQLKLDTGKWLTLVIDTQGGFMITLENDKI